jgi:hypothetical protein
MISYIYNNVVSANYDILTFLCVAPAATLVSIDPNIIQHRLVSDPSGCVSPLDSHTKGIHT